jgi:hypothetical protein
MAHDMRFLGIEAADQPGDIARQALGVIRSPAGWLRREIVAAHIRCDHTKARVREDGDLPAPGVPELREAVEQDHEWTLAPLHIVEPNTLDLEVGLAEVRDLG